MSSVPHEWIVQKYGGTSVGKFLPLITGEIVPRYLENYKIALVCSAVSGTEKASGTTSQLSRAIVFAGKGSLEDVQEVIQDVQDEHFRMLRSLDPNNQYPSATASAQSEIGHVCSELQRLLCNFSEPLSTNKKDRIVTTGEKLAAILVVTALTTRGIDAKLVSLHDVVAAAYGPDPQFHQAELYRLGPRFFHPLADEIARLILVCDARVPVVTGCFGSVPNSLITSVGKGYSDFCAALCASGLGAAELQIWKEVDGVFTADPRKISTARLLPTLTLEEARELTHYGSQVIHPFTMDQLRHGGIPLKLKNVLRPAGGGTIICPSPEVSGSNTPPTPPPPTIFRPPFLGLSGRQDDYQNQGKPTAITSKSSIVLVNIQSNREAKSLRFLAEVFRRLNELDAVVELSTSSEQSVSVALSIRNKAELASLVASLDSCGKVYVLHDMAIIAVIGQKMKSTIGVAAQIFLALAKDGVNIYFIGQGATEINISVVVQKADELKAIDDIHTQVLGIPHQNNAIKELVIGPWLY